MSAHGRVSRTDGVLGFVLCLVAASSIALLFGLVWDLEAPYWAARTPLIVASRDRAASAAKIGGRFVGTAAGAAVALAIAYTVPAPCVVILVLAVWLGLCATISHKRSPAVGWYACVLAGYSALVIVLHPHVGDPDPLASTLSRVLAVWLGLLCYAVALVVPSLAARRPADPRPFPPALAPPEGPWSRSVAAGLLATVAVLVAAPLAELIGWPQGPVFIQGPESSSASTPPGCDRHTRRCGSLWGWPCAAAQEPEVDFGEFSAVIGGVVMRLRMFVLGCRTRAGGAHCLCEPGSRFLATASGCGSASRRPPPGRASRSAVSTTTNSSTSAMEHSAAPRLRERQCATGSASARPPAASCRSGTAGMARGRCRCALSAPVPIPSCRRQGRCRSRDR